MPYLPVVCPICMKLAAEAEAGAGHNHIAAVRTRCQNRRCHVFLYWGMTDGEVWVEAVTLAGIKTTCPR